MRTPTRSGPRCRSCAPRKRRCDVTRTIRVTRRQPQCRHLRPRPGRVPAMTSRITARLLAAVAGTALLVAACGSGAATTAPTTTPTAVPVATDIPSGTNGAEPSFDLSSFHADVQLEGLLPKSIGGAPVTPVSMDGSAMVGQNGSPELIATLSAVGKT